MEEIVPGTENLVLERGVFETDDDARLRRADVRLRSRGWAGGGNLTVLDARARSVAGVPRTGMGNAVRAGMLATLAVGRVSARVIDRVPDSVVTAGQLVTGNGVVVGTLGSTVCADPRRPHEGDGEEQSSPSTRS